MSEGHNASEAEIRPNINRSPVNHAIEQARQGFARLKFKISLIRSTEYEAQTRKLEHLVEQQIGKVPEGHIRLYRGEPENFGGVPKFSAESDTTVADHGDFRAAGRWFTTNIRHASMHATSDYGRNGKPVEPYMLCLDLPEDIASQYIGKSGTLDPDGTPLHPDAALLPTALVKKVKAKIVLQTPKIKP